MKTLFLTFVVAVLVSGCAGSGGPAEQTGRTMDHGVQKVGQGVSNAGEKIQDVAH